MNLLAFDTGTESMSIAVARAGQDGPRLWQVEAPGGARASTDLIPAILDLLRQADLRLEQLNAVVFGAGPGSFTGLRTACSVAQGLAFGARVPVLPVDSLLAVAEDARATALGAQASGMVTAVLDARMDELYTATYAWNAAGIWTTVQPSTLVRPEDLTRPELSGVAADAPWIVAGNAFAAYGDRVAAASPFAATAQRIPALPRAAAMLRLAPRLITAGHTVAAQEALPSYIRDKVAKTTAERMAEKAAAAGVSR
jgi:tRNA threonylcarbamoyladenosine biosynthesis protein TsaB